MKTLDKVKLGETVKLAKILGEQDRVFRRFLELGFTPGQKVKLLKTSIANKVALIEIRGYVLSVRKVLLERVVVE